MSISSRPLFILEFPELCAKCPTYLPLQLKKIKLKDIVEKKVTILLENKDISKD
jgi:hypothetical protein